MRESGMVLARLALWRPRQAGPAPMRDTDVGSVEGVPRTMSLLYRDAAREGALAPERLAAIRQRIAVVSPRMVAILHQYLTELWCACGDAAREGAVEALTHSVDAGLEDLEWFDRCPLLVAIRGDARFASLRARVAARADEAAKGIADPLP